MLNITVTEGGERLYIHPIAVDKDLRKNKILYFKGNEFPPKYNIYILTKSWFSQLLFNKKKYLWYAYIKPFILTIKDTLINCWEWKSKYPLKLFTQEFIVGHVPIIAKDIFYGYITVHGQLELHDPDGWTDNTYYLTPSQKYLHKRMEEWLNKEDQDDFDRENRQEFNEWKNKVTSEGLIIVYLCSLDT